ncbi:hypothetical protein HanIR_Chr11g0504071 [Helianthus annuus]|nr:hypothetical protein HanIR_Chr11g0504071 [Helianthus annuus]
MEDETLESTPSLLDLFAAIARVYRGSDSIERISPKSSFVVKTVPEPSFCCYFSPIN